MIALPRILFRKELAFPVAGSVERLVEVGDMEKGFCNPFEQV
jgi:hypothetical protein